MDRVILGDNQFFGVDHLSDDKARQKEQKFRDTREIIKVLDSAYEVGIRTFMCTTYARIEEICSHIRKNPAQYSDFKIYPCMPYAHKYANAVTEMGIAGTLKHYTGGNVVSTIARGGLAVVQRDAFKLMQILVDTEMAMFRGMDVGVIFLQNVVTDLFHDKTVEEMATYGRHRKLGVHVLAQHPSKLLPVVRANADIAFILPVDTASGLDTLAKDYFGTFPIHKAHEILTTWAWKDPRGVSQAIAYVKKQGHTIHDRFFVISAPDPGPFQIGCRAYWRKEDTMPSEEEIASWKREIEGEEEEEDSDGEAGFTCYASDAAQRPPSSSISGNSQGTPATSTRPPPQPGKPH